MVKIVSSRRFTATFVGIFKSGLSGSIKYKEGLDSYVLYLNSFHLEVSLPSVCGNFRGGLSSIQMNSLRRFRQLPERPLLKMPHAVAVKRRVETILT